MTPSTKNLKVATSNKALKVNEVRGGEKPKLSRGAFKAVKLDNDSFQQALVKALEKSGIFKQVSTEKNGDYELFAEIIGQRSRLGSGLATITASLFVSYRLVETSTGQEVWKENIFSQHKAEPGSGPYIWQNPGMGTLMAAYEDAVRQNLTQLLQKLSDLLSKPKQT
ncbi:MAG: hypothetical protein HYY20_07325 [Candidatus Tectomicrobia bacterium]|uniref:Uncharacterized protein n=1 Tax=Tectimicrobiota bacterium TaxID=2528274 RepID=A0A932CP35_UNCTE|nr:hypothetical protein [Candidatus Tectomicrobia bacterium]